MSEPQHPQPHDTDTNEGHPAPVARAVVQPVVQPGLDSLAAVGARLTQLRESKGWSIEDVSARLKVSVIKLRALESGDISHLPDTTFALGVVRSYAKMLGADPTPFTQALRREKGVPAPDLSMPASSGKDLPRGRVSLSLGGSGQKSRSWLWGVAAVIVAVIALAHVAYQRRRFDGVARAFEGERERRCRWRDRRIGRGGAGSSRRVREAARKRQRRRRKRRPQRITQRRPRRCPRRWLPVPRRRRRRLSRQWRPRRRPARRLRPLRHARARRPRGGRIGGSGGAGRR